MIGNAVPVKIAKAIADKTKSDLASPLEKKKREVNVPMPRFYAFFSGAFFFAAFFLATDIASGFYV
jgi:hypothetical protein